MGEQLKLAVVLIMLVASATVLAVGVGFWMGYNSIHPVEVSGGAPNIDP